jgi:hypothetical protein
VSQGDRSSVVTGEPQALPVARPLRPRLSLSGADTGRQRLGFAAGDGPGPQGERRHSSIGNDVKDDGGGGSFSGSSNTRGAPSSARYVASTASTRFM